MKLITKEIEKELLKNPLYSHDGEGENAKVIIKFFYGAYTFLVTEGNPIRDNSGKIIDWHFFGYATHGYEWEWGYTNLSEIQAVKKYGYPCIEREMYTGIKEYTVKELIK
jgi:hypothetical protein